MGLGYALWVYCITPGLLFHSDSRVDMSFFLDDVHVGDFINEPTAYNSYDYNVVVYSNESIPNGLHTFTVYNGHMTDAGCTLVLFDYLIYTYVVKPEFSKYHLI